MNVALLVPWGYGSTLKPLGEVLDILTAQAYHPNYLRCVGPWFESKGGDVGPGGTRREFGEQPDRPGFAPDRESFHQPQTYNDGWTGPSAIDLLAKDGPDAGASHDSVRWDMVPRQGSAEAARCGLHCNIDTEAWHLQGIYIDGFRSWVNAGRPVPVAADFPIPGIVLPPVVGSKSYVVQTGDGWNKITAALGVTGAELDASGTVTRGGKVLRIAPIGRFVVWPGDLVTVGAPVEQTYRNTLPPTVPPSLRWGDQGDRVRQLQIVLRIQADGQFGPATDFAVKEVQRNSRVTIDGVYGKQTDGALRRYLESVGLPH